MKKQWIVLMLVWTLMFGSCTAPERPQPKLHSEGSAVSSERVQPSSEQESEPDSSLEQTVSEPEPAKPSSSAEKSVLQEDSSSSKLLTGEPEVPVPDEPKMYLWKGSSRTQAPQAPVPVTLVLNNAPIPVSIEDMTYEDFSTDTPLLTDKNGNTKVYDAVVSQNRLRVEVMMGNGRKSAISVPWVERIVFDSLFELLEDGTLLIPTSSQGIYAFNVDENRLLMQNKTTVLTTAADGFAPHRLLGFLYDKQANRFLLLHTKHVEKDEDGNPLGKVTTMKITVCDLHWNMLAVYDTGLMPDMNAVQNYPVSYGFTITDRGLIAVGGPNSRKEAIIAYPE